MQFITLVFAALAAASPMNVQRAAEPSALANAPYYGSNGGDNGGHNACPNGGYNGGDNGGHNGGDNGGDNGGHNGGDNGGHNGGDNGGHNGGDNGGDNGGNDGGNDGGDNGGNDGGLTQFSCPGLLQSPQCCQIDVLDLVSLTCEPPSSNIFSRESFRAECAETGTTANCCVLPILGQGLICQDV